MKTKIVKLKFNTDLHYGNFGKPGLLSTDNYIASDTLYSAFCDIDSKNIEKIISLVENNQLRISDALPYVGDELLIPMPPEGIKVAENLEINRTLYKKLKKVKFIPYLKHKELFSGAFEKSINKTIALNENIGVFNERTQNILPRDISKDTLPYIVSTYRFYDNSGLYLLINYLEEEVLKYTLDLIKHLGFLGIGGKRSSGLGKFEILSVENFHQNENGKLMLLSTSLANSLKADLTFNVLKRSGFYRSDNKFYKKRDIYAIKSGLIVDEPFEGQILNNLSSNETIYRFLVPLFVRLDI